ncbi:MAG: hypothetical protein QNJ78_11600 [Gammaproteobacteria bacterium]|nr:hypothetical protein [Gammaproteobacteria bacterium]
MNSQIALLRRELWEHTSFRWLPLILLGIVLLANSAVAWMVHIDGMIHISTDHGPLSAMDLPQQFLELPLSQQELIVNTTLITTGMIINAVLTIMMVFYLLDSLYGERKDHSILFWKSLPVSDTRTVFTKLLVAVLIVPVTVFATRVAADLIVLLVHSISLREYSGEASLLWQRAHLAGIWGMFSIALVQQVIWSFPVMGWLLFCSAWSRKAPIIAAVLIPAMVVLVDTGFRLNTGVGELLLERFPLAVATLEVDNEMEALTYRSYFGGTKFGLNVTEGDIGLSMGNPRDYLSEPKVWYGLLVGALFIWLAIWLRRWQDDTL